MMYEGGQPDDTRQAMHIVYLPLAIRAININNHVYKI